MKGVNNKIIADFAEIYRLIGFITECEANKELLAKAKKIKLICGKYEEAD